MAPAAEKKPTKKSYIDLASVLMITSTFAGAFTLTTCFTIVCPEGRAATLLLWASQLFLSIPPAILIIYILLFSFEDNDPIDDTYQLALGAQFALILVLLTLLFTSIALAFFYFSKSEVLPIGGIAIIGVMVYLSYSTSRNWCHYLRPSILSRTLIAKTHYSILVIYPEYPCQRPCIISYTEYGGHTLGVFTCTSTPRFETHHPFAMRELDFHTRLQF